MCQGRAVIGNPPANAGDARDLGSIPGLGRSPGEEMATCSSILAWKIPWTEDYGKLQSVGLKRVRHNWTLWDPKNKYRDFGLPKGLSGWRICLQCRRRRSRGSIPGSGRSLGGSHGNPLQYFCLENPVDRGVWRLQSMGSQRVGHDWSDWTRMHAL